MLVFDNHGLYSHSRRSMQISYVTCHYSYSDMAVRTKATDETNTQLAIGRIFGFRHIVNESNFKISYNRRVCRFRTSAWNITKWTDNEIVTQYLQCTEHLSWPCSVCIHIKTETTKRLYFVCLKAQYDENKVCSIFLSTSLAILRLLWHYTWIRKE